MFKRMKPTRKEIVESNGPVRYIDIIYIHGHGPPTIAPTHDIPIPELLGGSSHLRDRGSSVDVPIPPIDRLNITPVHPRYAD